MTEPLLDRLDPERDYGPRTYEQVKREVETGVLKLEAGASVPVIRDVSTNRTVKGTGNPSRQRSAAAWSRGYIQRKFAKNAPALWEAAFRGAVGDKDHPPDPRWGKLLFEQGISSAMQNKTDDHSAEFVLKLLAAAADSSTTATVHAEVIDVESREVK